MVVVFCFISTLVEQKNTNTINAFGISDHSSHELSNSLGDLRCGGINSYPGPSLENLGK